MLEIGGYDWYLDTMILHSPRDRSEYVVNCKSRDVFDIDDLVRKTGYVITEYF